MSLGDGLQILGLALLVAFADTFGARWGLLAGGAALIILGFAYAGVMLSVPAPLRRRSGTVPEPPYGVVVGSPDY